MLESHVRTSRNKQLLLIPNCPVPSSVPICPNPGQSAEGENQHHATLRHGSESTPCQALTTKGPWDPSGSPHRFLMRKQPKEMEQPWAEGSDASPLFPTPASSYQLEQPIPLERVLKSWKLKLKAWADLSKKDSPLLQKSHRCGKICIAIFKPLISLVQRWPEHLVRTCWIYSALETSDFKGHYVYLHYVK